MLWAPWFVQRYERIVTWNVALSSVRITPPIFVSFLAMLCGASKITDDVSSRDNLFAGCSAIIAGRSTIYLLNRAPTRRSSMSPLVRSTRRSATI